MVVQGAITGLFCVGDTYTLSWTVENVPTSTPLTDGYCYVKTSNSIPDANATIAKHITTSLVAGVGQITDNGAATGTGAATVYLTATDTNLIQPAQSYVFAFKVKFSNGDEHTVEFGPFSALPNYITT